MTPPLDIDSFPRGILLVGDYGSGKTEVAVNLALQLAEKESGVAIADLDLVNPYFRCREAHEPLTRAGIRVVAPPGGHQFADLPILMPQVKGLLQDDACRAILDVGGDEAGSRVLAALAPAYSPRRHGFWFVVNTNRPFNDTAAGVKKTIQRIQRIAGLQVTGLVSNTHLMQETTAQMVRDGVAVAQEVANHIAVELKLVAVMEDMAGSLQEDSMDYPLMVMQRLMVPPWILRPKNATDPGCKLGQV